MFHFIGICGTAMATLAAMLKRKGRSVRGSDQDVYPPMSDFLAGEGLRKGNPLIACAAGVKTALIAAAAIPGLVL